MILAETPMHAFIGSDELSRKVIGEAMHVHRVLGPGFLESIYQNALLLRLQKIGLKAESGTPVPVYFEEVLMGNFQTDVVVEDRLLLELKAVSAIVPAHEVQLVNYLTATKLETGLLINFGAKSLEVKRRTRSWLAEKTARQNSEPSNLINRINPI